MGMVNFNRGELSPSMRYRSDLEVYHKGVELLGNILPTPRGGLVRRPGSQVLEILPASEAAPAVRTINIGATGLDHDIAAPAESAVIEVGDVTYESLGKIFDIPKNAEIQLSFVFVEPDYVAVHWLNTPSKMPVQIQKVWNLDTTYKRPELGFDDTRDVRIVQVENSIYVIAQEHIYRFYWDIKKVDDADLQWDHEQAYAVGDVILRLDGGTPHWFECILENTNVDPIDSTDFPTTYWQVSYPPYMSWEIVSPRVGLKMLEGIGAEEEPYAWIPNKPYLGSTLYKRGDVVRIEDGMTITFYECIAEYTTAATAPDITTLDAYFRLLPDTEATEEGEDERIFEKDRDHIYLRNTYAFREEVIPREIVSHQGRLIFASSSSRPSTLHGSEISHYMTFGAGVNDNEPFIFTLSGDRVGRILWMVVTDQLYIGTTGGVFAVAGVISPNQFQLRKVTAHAASDIEGVTASGSLIFFQKDKQTLREVAYAEQAQNYNAIDLTVFSDHLFKEYQAVKIIVQNAPQTILWILRADGVLISLTYEQTTDMFAFAKHELLGRILDIAPGVDEDFYTVVQQYVEDEHGEEIPGYTELVRVGYVTIIDEGDEAPPFLLDGLLTFTEIDTWNAFQAAINNESFRDYLWANGIRSVAQIMAKDTALTVSGAELTGTLASCMLHLFVAVPEIDLSNNGLTGTIPNLLQNILGLTSLDLSGNNLDNWDIGFTQVQDSLVTLNLSDNDLSAAQLHAIIESVWASETEVPRTGTLDLRDNAIIDVNSGLETAVALRTAGWTVLIDNTGDWWEGSVSFSANGGTGTPPDAIDCLFGETITLPTHTLEKDNFTDVGWNTAADGSGINYGYGVSYTRTTQDAVTLYVQWEAVFGVHYIANSGSNPPTDATEYQEGDPVTMKPPGDMNKLGHTFSYWSTTPSGAGPTYYPGDIVTMPAGALNLYARWTVNKYQVRYFGNGHTEGVVPSAQTIEYGEVVTVRPNSGGLGRLLSSGERKRFNGWNLNEAGTGTTYTAGSGTFTMPAQHVNLYARWTDYLVGDPGPAGGIILYAHSNYINHKYIVYTSFFGLDTMKDVLKNSSGNERGSHKYVEARRTDFGTSKYERWGTYATDGYRDWFWILGFSGWFEKLHSNRTAWAITFSYSKYWLYEYNGTIFGHRGYSIRASNYDISYSRDSNRTYLGVRLVRVF